MGLWADASADLRGFLENDDEFGQALTVVDPSDASAALKGFGVDIGLLIDPETGQGVAGRRGSVAISIASLTAAGLGMPVGISDASLKPWRVTFDDANGNSHTFKIQECQPDRALGVVVCILEAYWS